MVLESAAGFNSVSARDKCDSVHLIVQASNAVSPRYCLIYFLWLALEVYKMRILVAFGKRCDVTKCYYSLKISGRIDVLQKMT